MFTDHTPPITEDVEVLKAVLRDGWKTYVPSGLVAFDGDDDDDAGDDDDTDDDDTDDDDTEAKSKKTKKAAAKSKDDDGDDGDDEEEDDETAQELARLKKENQDLRKRESEARKRQRKIEREAQRKAEAERSENGDHEQIIADRDKEIARLTAQIADGEFDRAVARIASDLRFKDPDLASALLRQQTDLRDSAVDDDGEVDERLVERELRAIVKKHDYLVNPEKKSQRDVTPSRQKNGHSDEYEYQPGGLADAIASSSGSRS